MPTSPINRRTFLRGTGIALGLPLLESMLPASLRAAAVAKSPDVRRMLAICAPLGIHTPYLFPAETGRDYKPTRYLKPLQPLCEKLTIMSGLRHPDDIGVKADAFSTGKGTMPGI